MARVNVGKWSAVCAIVLSGAALLAAAPASADPTDDAFVAALAKGGIAVTDRDAAIGMAHNVCAGFDKSNKSSVVAMKLTTDSGLSLKQSGYFIGASISAYCPQYIGRIDNSTNWLNPVPPHM